MLIPPSFRPPHGLLVFYPFKHVFSTKLKPKHAVEDLLDKSSCVAAPLGSVIKNKNLKIWDL